MGTDRRQLHRIIDRLCDEAESIDPALELPVEYLNVYLVFFPGAKKHGSNGWLDSNLSLAKGMSIRDNVASINRHLNKAVYSAEKIDPELQLDHFLPVAWRALAAYTRKSRSLSI